TSRGDSLAHSPSCVAVHLTQHRARVAMAVMIRADAFGAADQHDHGFVVAQRDTCRLTPAHRIRHERQLVAVRIASHPTRRDITIQKSFELRFRTEGEGSYLRMPS